MPLDYGIIGNCKTAALVKKDASIEWCCFPRFDSPSVFARILDDNAGHFSIIPSGKYQITQNYIENTNVLETHFKSKDAEFVVTDYFPLHCKDDELIQNDSIQRIITPKKGKPKITIIFNPKMDYARGKTEISLNENCIKAGNHDHLYLYTNLDQKKIISQEELVLEEDSYLVVRFNVMRGGTSIDSIKADLKTTIEYWEEYASTIKPPKIAQKEVIRSILTLKLLTYCKTGAMVAAATTSLPETIGGPRNWDYRYCWIRDSSFASEAFDNAEKFEEAERFLEFVMSICKRPDDLRIMYGVEGETELREHTLDHLSGYMNSKPVRIGNAAYTQIQIDVVGELVDAFYRYHSKKGNPPMDSERREFVRALIDRAIELRHRKDSGIWEFRGRREHFLFSKIMCWVALDRGIKFTEEFGYDWPVDEWKKLEQEIKEEMFRFGWSEKKRSFGMYYGSGHLDASLLLMVYYELLEANDVFFVDTVRAIEKNLTDEEDKELVMRYKMKDDSGRPKNSFVMPCFWLIDALYLIGDKKKARELFEKMLARSNHLGLYSEDITLDTKELTGNFPQSYSHSALVNTAFLLSSK